jgi:hypothetical protein
MCGMCCQNFLSERVLHGLTTHLGHYQDPQVQQIQRQLAIETLQDWKQAVIGLGRPDVYVQRIQEIMDDHGKGKPLNENQIERLSQDLAEYREQLRQVQIQRQRSPRIGGFGL